MDLDDKEDMKQVRRLQYLSEYGSCQTRFLVDWNKTCCQCSLNKSSVRSLQEICLRSLVQNPVIDEMLFSHLPHSLYDLLMECALSCESSAVCSILKFWPKSYFSLVDVLSSHNFQCFLPWRREKFAKSLILSFLNMLLKEVNFKVQVLDIRGAIISDEEDIAKICELIGDIRKNQPLNSEEYRILFDIEVSEDLFDQLTSVIILNPEINPESTSTLQVYLGHFQASEGTLRQGQGIKSYLRKLISFTSSKLESLCVSNAFLKNSGLRKILSELKLPKYANLVALNVANNDLDLPNCPMTVDLVAQCIGDLTQLRYLNLSQNPMTGCLEYVLCNLQTGLLDLRVSGCDLDSVDISYLMNSIHAKTLLAVDISENSFEEQIPLEQFFEAFSPQLLAIEAEACGIDSDKLIDLAWSVQHLERLHYISLVGYWMTIDELIPVVKRLCLCKSLRTVVFSLPVDVEFDVEDVNHLKALVFPIEQSVEEHEGNFFIQWI